MTRTDQGDSLSLALPLPGTLLHSRLPSQTSARRQTLISPSFLPLRQVFLSLTPKGLWDYRKDPEQLSPPGMGSPSPWASSSHFQGLSSLQEGPLGLTYVLPEDRTRDSGIYTREKDLAWACSLPQSYLDMSVQQWWNHSSAPSAEQCAFPASRCTQPLWDTLRSEAVYASLIRDKVALMLSFKVVT